MILFIYLFFALFLFPTINSSLLKKELVIIWMYKVSKIAVRKHLNKWNINFQVSITGRIVFRGKWGFLLEEYWIWMSSGERIGILIEMWVSRTSREGRTGVRKRFGLLPIFVSKALLGLQYPFVYLVFMVTKTMCPAIPQMFTLWPFKKKFCQYLG